jgi:hypothetical protein
VECKVVLQRIKSCRHVADLRLEFADLCRQRADLARERRFALAGLRNAGAE